MLVFVVDDEPLLLHDAALTVKEAAPKAEIRSFARPAAALQAMSEQGLHPELVFSDIEMPGMSGLEFAVRLKKLSPDTRVVFVTGYAQYALDAFKVRAQGYSLKPLTVEQVREELEVLASSFETKKETQRKKLCVRCFGHFEVYWQGEPVVFARRQSKELFAFLIDREGAVCTPE